MRRTDGVAEMIARIGGVADEDGDIRLGGETDVSVTSYDDSIVQKCD